MFCKQCGKEISEESHFCSFCGANVKDIINEAEKNSYVDSEVSELFYNKRHSFPVNLTIRSLFDSREWWKGELQIASNAVFLCCSETFDVQSICNYFLNCYDNLWHETSDDNIPACFSSAINSALHDFKHRKAGTLYIVNVKEIQKYVRELCCIVQITGRSYKYIVGVIKYLNDR